MSFSSACVRGDIDAVKAYISIVKDSVNLVTYELNNGLESACAQGHLEIVRLLISIYLPSTLKHSFYNACRRGHLEIIQFLMSKFPKTISWSSCFEGACCGGHLEIVKFVVLKAIETKNENENTLWRYYSWLYDKPEIRALLYLKTPLTAFQCIDGFQKLNNLVVETKQAIKTANVLVPDLLNIVAGCIII